MIKITIIMGVDHKGDIVEGWVQWEGGEEMRGNEGWGELKYVTYMYGDNTKKPNTVFTRQEGERG
jgi:hypothetical protein